MTSDEQDLLERARHGDAHAVDELLARHQKQVYRFGLRMCGDEEAALEVLQQTLLTAFRTLHSFRQEAALSTWLYQIARSACMKHRRPTQVDVRRMVTLDSPEARRVESDKPDPEARAHAREMAEVLEAAILALPESQREVLILRDVEGLSAEEAAEVIGVEVGALKSRLHRARGELRGHLSTLLDSAGEGTDCPELGKDVASWGSADIDQVTCLRIEEHLARCPRCRTACEGLKRTVSLCRSIPGDEVPRSVQAAVRRALLGATPDPSVP